MRAGGRRHDTHALRYHFGSCGSHEGSETFHAHGRDFTGWSLTALAGRTPKTAHALALVEGPARQDREVVLAALVRPAPRPPRDAASAEAMAEAGEPPYYVVLKQAPTSRDPTGTAYRGVYDCSSESLALLRHAVEGDVRGKPGRAWDIHSESSGKESFCHLATAQEFYLAVNGHPARIHFPTRRSCSVRAASVTCTVCAARLRDLRRAPSSSSGGPPVPGG